jgi:broad specificity phosphatase PhoE
MTKDAVAGRIRRLLATADKRASELGIPGTDAALAEADIDALEAELHAELDS